MRIDSDTRDSLLFITGLVGIISQGILVGFGVPISIPLCGLYGTMAGIGAVPTIVDAAKRRGSKDGNRDA